MNKKRNSIVMTVALLVLTVGGSLAYFTDSVTNDVPMDSGSVILEDNTVSLGANLMVPGDTLELPIKATQVGENTAKVRLRIINHVDNSGLATFADSASSKGFVVQKNSANVNITGKGYVEEVVDPVLSNGSIAFTGLRVKLLENSGNEYQNQTTKLTYIIEAIQNDHTNWTQVDNGEITIKTQH